MTPAPSATAEILARIETKLDALNTSVTDIARIQAVQEHRVSQAERQICQNEDDVKSLVQTVQKLEATVKVTAGVMGFIGMAAGGWVLSQILGLIP